MTRRRSILLALAVGVALTGCARHRAERAWRADLHARLDAFRHERPLDEVWAEARRLLAERRYPLAGADAAAVGQRAAFLSGLLSPAKETRDNGEGGRMLETGWRKGLRYRVDGWPDGERRARILITAIEEDQTEHARERSRRRDVELELELVRRLAPEEAVRLERGGP